MQFMRPEKQKEKSRETMDIYAPIAHRLGISKIKVELDDLALCYLKPDVYEDLEKSLNSAKEEREAFIQEIVEEVKGHIDRAGIKAEIDGRVKHMFSIYKKMVMRCINQFQEDSKTILQCQNQICISHCIQH